MNLADWLQEHYADRCYRPFTEPQRLAVKYLESGIVERHSVAYTMDRGDGASTLAIGATLWALAERHASFVAFFTAHANRAALVAENIVDAALRTPFFSRDGSYRDRWIEFGRDGGQAVRCLGIRSSVVGLSYRGRRPDLVVVDSPYGAAALASVTMRRQIDEIICRKLPCLGSAERLAPVLVLDSRDGARPR